MKNRDLLAMLPRYKKKFPIRKAGIAAAVAAVLCTALILSGVFSQIPKTRAAELQSNDSGYISNPEEIVEKFLQALIRRDEDYARSLLNFNTELPLTVSNPHLSGYRILSSGCVNGKTYVEAEMDLQYTANPYHQIVGCRYELSKSEDGYRIDRIAETKIIEVAEQNGTIFIRNGGRKKDILKLRNIPDEYIGNSYSYRLSSLFYLESSNKLVMAIQLMNETGKSISVILQSYDLGKGSFDFLDKIEAEKGSVGVSGQSIDPKGKYLAVDILLEKGDGPGSTVYVYHMPDKSKTALDTLLKDTDIDAIHLQYWSGEGLVFEALKDGLTIRYLYKTGNGSTVQTIMVGSSAEPVL